MVEEGRGERPKTEKPAIDEWAILVNRKIHTIEVIDQGKPEEDPNKKRTLILKPLSIGEVRSLFDFIVQDLATGFFDSLEKIGKGKESDKPVTELTPEEAKAEFQPVIEGIAGLLADSEDLLVKFLYKVFPKKKYPWLSKEFIVASITMDHLDEIIQVVLKQNRLDRLLKNFLGPTLNKILKV